MGTTDSPTANLLGKTQKSLVQSISLLIRDLNCRKPASSHMWWTAEWKYRIVIEITTSWVREIFWSQGSYPSISCPT